jgi:membrane protease subunit (stomatin/prohibitin family)
LNGYRERKTSLGKMGARFLYVRASRFPLSGVIVKRLGKAWGKSGITVQTLRLRFEVECVQLLHFYKK